MKTHARPELEAVIETLAVQAHAVLRAHPQGLTEHALIRALAADGGPFSDADLQDPLSLFRTHFLLFHVLYRLRDRLVAEEATDVLIGPLEIRLRAVAAATDGALGRHDPLRAYYLDLGNLERTDRDQVESLLAAFWRRLAQGGEDRDRDLAVLGLEATADGEAVRRRYRRLAMTHHPDRGGDPETFKRIQAAYARLARRLP